MDETETSDEAAYFARLAALFAQTQANLTSGLPAADGDASGSAVLALVAGLTTFAEGLASLRPPGLCQAAHASLLEAVAKETDILSVQARLTDVPEAAGLSECLLAGQEALRTLAGLAAESGVSFVVPDPPQRFGWA
jgi:hypothetical protein